MPRLISWLTPGLALLCMSVPAPALAWEPDQETLQASTLHPDRMIDGPRYRVAPEVVNRGLMNHYRIETEYGLMTAQSDRELGKRIREVHALAELESMDESLLMAESAGDSVWRTARSIVRVATDPVGMAQGLQQGIQRMFRRGGRKLRNAYDDVKTAIVDRDGDGGTGNGTDLSNKAMHAGTTFARNRLGVSRAYRELSREVGVDPYTRNRILTDELDRLAKHAAGASLGSRLVMPTIPGLIGVVGDVSRLVWEKDQLDLLFHNEAVLQSLSIPEAIVRGFTENESYSPTQQTEITSSVAAMKDVKNLWRLIDYAGEASGIAEAEFYTGMIGLLSLYHANRTKLLSIHATDTFVPVAFTRDTRVVVAFPVDLLRWTRSVGGIMSALNDSRAQGVRHREIWITGRISDGARPGLAGYGWIPFDRAHLRLREPQVGRASASVN